MSLSMRRPRHAGFTLLEVMIALAILAGSLVVLLRMSSTDIRAAHQAKLMGIATGLARGKMYDIEEILLKDGFQETTQKIDGDFGDEGMKRFTWEAVIERVELPTAETIQAEKGAKGKTGAVPPPAATDKANSDNLLGIAGGSQGGALGAGMVQMYFPLIKPVLEGAIRKVTLTVKWQIGAQEQSMKVTCFFTDTKPIDVAMRSMIPGAAAAGSSPANPPASSAASSGVR